METKAYRILVVEDNPGDFVIIEDLLSEILSDARVTNAIDFKQADSLLQDNVTPFDIILLDLSLPDKAGNDLITEIVRIAPDCPIIILTGFSDMNFTIQAISLGIEDYLVKDDLSATILLKSISYSIERKKSKSELKESEKRYSNLFHLSPQPMWVYDTQTYKFIQTNKAAVKHYGYTEEEFLQMSMFDIYQESEIPKLQETVRHLSQNNIGPYNVRSRHINKAGDFMEVEIYSTPINIGDRPLRSVIAFDITEKIQHEQLITKAIIKTQEEERYEIGSELHDNICQILALSQMNLDKLKDSLNPDTLPWYEHSRKTMLLALDEIRNLSHRLAPAFYDEMTFEESFRKLIKTFDVNKKYRITLSFDDKLSNKDVHNEMQLNLYRILQEQLRNIEKYASATEIKIFVLVRNENLYMTTADNGIGFIMDRQKKGIGFANMKRRVELFNGDIQIDTSPGKGCKIVINIPLKKRDE